MDKKIQKFVEEYNKVMDWNTELRQNLVESNKFRTEYCSEVLDDYLSISKITPENTEIETAKIFDLENGKYELHAFSYQTCHDKYYWVKFDQSKEDYIADRVKILNRVLGERIATVNAKIAELSKEQNEIEILVTNLKNI